MCVHVGRVSVTLEMANSSLDRAQVCRRAPPMQRVIASGKIPVLASSKCPISWVLSCKHIENTLLLVW